MIRANSSLRLTSVEINGKMTAISTSAFRAKGKSHTKSNVTKTGGGAAAGALIGGLAGGGKGALIEPRLVLEQEPVAAATGKEEAGIHAGDGVYGFYYPDGHCEVSLIVNVWRRGKQLHTSCLGCAFHCALQILQHPLLRGLPASPCRRCG